MLQINSGKLFTREIEYRNELRGVLYTNLRLPRDRPIETVAGRLLPVSTLHHSHALVYEVTELIESQASGPGVLRSHGAEPYLHDFATVVSFALNVICSPDPDLLGRLIGSHGGLVPSNQLMRRSFDEEISCQESESHQFTTFVKDLIALERRSYLAAMRAMRTLVTGVHRLADDLGLAYTLMVASLESLTQGFDGHRATRADYEESKRTLIDNALEGAEEKIARRVRDALLEIEHVSLMRRFRDFTLGYLQPSFFREEADGLNSPVGRAELTGALQAAYRSRSKHIHNLQELPRLLTIGTTFADTTTTDEGTMLTFQGLTRLARHVIFEFVRRQPKVDAESYDHRFEQPGIVRVRLAPEYWLGRPSGLKPEMGPSRLSGFLQQITPVLLGLPDAKVTDLRTVLAEVEILLKAMKDEQRRPWTTLYLLFNRLVSSELRMPNFEAIWKQNSSVLEGPSVESMIAHLLLGSVPAWGLPPHASIHEIYFRRRDRKNGIQAPRVLEAGLSLTLAERYRLAGNFDQAREMIGFAVENHPGHAPLRELERSFQEEAPIDWQLILLPPKA